MRNFKFLLSLVILVLAFNMPPGGVTAATTDHNETIYTVSVNDMSTDITITADQPVIMYACSQSPGETYFGITVTAPVVVNVSIEEDAYIYIKTPLNSESGDNLNDPSGRLLLILNIDTGLSCSRSTYITYNDFRVCYSFNGFNLNIHDPGDI